MRKRYQIDQSPLWKLRSRRKLAELLRISLRDLEQISKDGDKNYRQFGKKSGGKKERWIEHPKPRLTQIQKRLNSLFDRIEFPDYLFSGVKCRSYVDNAELHRCDENLAKIDIRSFFVSASASRVSRAFRDQFNCSPDVAAVLMKITTINGHIPTGGNSSCIISFLAYKPMFDKIFELSKSHGLTMSLCVDDMTFSGANATNNFLFLVRKIVVGYGLECHKRKVYSAKANKIVTGVALTAKGYRLPNARRKALHHSIQTFRMGADNVTNEVVSEMIGRVSEAVSIEPRFNSLKTRLLKQTREMAI